MMIVVMGLATITGIGWGAIPGARANGPTSLPCGVKALTLLTKSDGAAELLALTNQERAAAGMAPLAGRGDVAVIAEAHARVMALAGEIFHNDGYFTSATKALLGTRYQGENVGCASTVAESHAGFMRSEGHRANILNPRFTHAGYAVVVAGDGRHYTVQAFLEGSGAPAAAAPPAPAPPPPPPPAPAPAPAPATVTPPPPAAAPPPSQPAPAPATPAVPTAPAPPATTAPVTAPAAAAPAGEVAAAPLVSPQPAPLTRTAADHTLAFATAGMLLLVTGALVTVRRSRGAQSVRLA
jgi:hypothetical protein